MISQKVLSKIIQIDLVLLLSTVQVDSQVSVFFLDLWTIEEDLRPLVNTTTEINQDTAA